MKRSSGFTLVEVMIVLVVIAAIAFLGMNAIRGTFKAKSRELSWRLTSTVKYLFNSAITDNKTVRIVFDIDNGQYWAESTSDKFLMENRAKADEKRLEKRLGGEVKGEKEKGKEEEAEPVAEKKDTGSAENGEEAPTEAPQVEPIEATFGALEDVVFEAKPIPAGVFIKDVWTSHDNGPVESGRAYIYFFASGYAEPSIINFRDEADEKHISIKIDPFTGGVGLSQEYRKLE